MIDIDKFKVLNDQYGHLEGDNAINSVGKILVKSTAESDALVFRYVGDEFIVLMTIKDEEEIINTMNRIQKVTDEYNKLSGKPYKLSFSMGYTTYDKEDTFDSFLNRVDNETYRDKRSN